MEHLLVCCCCWYWLLRLLGIFSHTIILTPLPFFLFFIAVKNPLVRKHYKKVMKQTLILMMYFFLFFSLFSFLLSFSFLSLFFLFSHFLYFLRITYVLAFIFYVLPLRFFYLIFGWDLDEEGCPSLFYFFLPFSPFFFPSYLIVSVNLVGVFELSVLLQIGYIVPHIYFVVVELFFGKINEVPLSSLSPFLPPKNVMFK